MRFMDEKAAERHPDWLVSSSAVLQVCKFMRTPSQLLLYSSGRLDISPYSSRSTLQDAFYGEESSFEAPRLPFMPPECGHG